MFLVDHEGVSHFLERDTIKPKLAELTLYGDSDLACQKWLSDSDAKRFIFSEMYADLLEANGLRILDVGGGLTSFTRQLAKQHDYVLVDMLAHDEEETAKQFMSEAGNNYIHVCDWYDYQGTGMFDVVIANDLFPNVDQRVEMFIERYLPIAGEIRLSLTYYNEHRFYKARRIDADEYLCMLAWDGGMLKRVLQKYQNMITDADLDLLTKDNRSVYPNKRQVCLVTIAANVNKIEKPL